MIQYIRQAITTNGGTPQSSTVSGALRELVTAYGGTPTQYSVIGLLREAVSAKGGTPTQWTVVGLLRELLTALGAASTSFNEQVLWALVATSGGGAAVPGALAGAIVGFSALAATIAITVSLTGSVVGVSTASASVSVTGQLVGAIAGVSAVAGTLTNTSGGYSAEATTYFAAMTVQPDPTRKALVDTLISGLKTDGIWSKLDWLCLIAAHDAQAGILNAKNTAKSLAAVNSPTFTTDRGYAGDGATSYLTFGESVAAAGNNASLDSTTVGAWCNQMGAGTGLQYHIGKITNGVPVSRLGAHGTAASSETYLINDGTASTSRASTGTRVGHRAASRTASNSKRAYFAGALVANLTTPSTSASTAAMTALRNDTVYSSDRLAAVYTGSGMTDAEIANLDSRLSTYLTAIGAS